MISPNKSFFMLIRFGYLMWCNLCAKNSYLCDEDCKTDLMQKYLIVFVLASIFYGCGHSRVLSESGLDTLYVPSYASHFLVLGSGDTTILRVKNPWQGATGVEYDYRFMDSVSSVITMSSSHSAFLEVLGEGDLVVGVSGARYLTSEKMRSLPDVGYDNNMNYELMVALRPSLVTIYEIAGENSATTKKLEALGLRTVYVADYLEDSPLAKAEWIVAFGAISGQMDRAREIFKGVENGYNAIRDSVAQARVTPVKVMFNSPYRDVWYLPSDSSYIVRMLIDAGGEYVAAGTEGNVSRAVSVEVAYAMLKKADVWLNPSGHIVSKAQLKGENALLQDVDIPVFSNNARGSESGGSDFWESGTIHPDVALKDMVKILHPKILPSYEPYYYRELK